MTNVKFDLSKLWFRFIT